MLNLTPIREIYRRMEGGDGAPNRGWGMGKVRLRISTGGHKEADGTPNAIYRDTLWALEVIKEYAESNRTGQPMRKVNREPVRYEVKGGRPRD